MNRTNIPRVMTDGPITSHLLRFAFLIMFSSLFHLIYSLADTIVVGKFLGGKYSSRCDRHRACYLSDVFHSIGYQYGVICCAGSSIRIGRSRKFWE